MEPAACLPHSEAKKKIPKAKPKPISHQALIRRHPHLSLVFIFYKVSSVLEILKWGEKKEQGFLCVKVS